MTLEELRVETLEVKVDYICDYIISHGLGPKFRYMSFQGVIEEYGDIMDAFREVNRGLRGVAGRWSLNEFKGEVVKAVLNHELLYPRIKEEIRKL